MIVPTSAKVVYRRNPLEPAASQEAAGFFLRDGWSAERRGAYRRKEPPISRITTDTNLRVRPADPVRSAESGRSEEAKPPFREPRLLISSARDLNPDP